MLSGRPRSCSQCSARRDHADGRTAGSLSAARGIAGWRGGPTGQDGRRSRGRTAGLRRGVARHGAAHGEWRRRGGGRRRWRRTRSRRRDRAVRGAALAVRQCAAGSSRDRHAPDHGLLRLRRDAPSVRGAEDTTDAVRLEPGRTYRSSIGPGRGGKLYYRLELDATPTAYVSATAVPRPGATVSYADGLKVSLQDGDGRTCSPSGSAHFGATQSPHPIAASAARETSRAAVRLSGGRARTTWSSSAVRGSGPSAASRPSGLGRAGWDLELAMRRSPRLKKAGRDECAGGLGLRLARALTGTPRRRGGRRGLPRRDPPRPGRLAGPASARDRPASTRSPSTGDSSSTPPPNWAVRGSGDGLCGHRPRRVPLQPRARLRRRRRRGIRRPPAVGRARPAAARRLREPVRAQRPRERHALRGLVLPRRPPRRAGRRHASATARSG